MENEKLNLVSQKGKDCITEKSRQSVQEVKVKDSFPKNKDYFII